MKNAKKLLAKLMVFALVLAYIPTTSMNTSAASSKVTTKMYTLSQKAGTYTDGFKLTITAKKGYKVYYSTGSNLSIKKVVKSGKRKTIKISKTTTLKIYAVKKSTTITKKKLKTSAVKKKTKSYKYVIDEDTENTDNNTTNATTDTTTQASTTQTTSNSATTSTDTTASSETKASSDTTSSSGNTDSSKNSKNSETSSGNNTSSDNDSSSGNSSGTTTPSEDDSTPEQSSDESSTKSTEKESVVISDNEKTVELSITSYDDNTDNISSETNDEGTTVTVSSAGTYTLTGYSANLHLDITAKDSSDESPVVLNLDSINIDNGKETSDDPIIEISKDTANVTINFTGKSTIIGASAFTDSPAALISAANSSITLTGDDDAVVNLVDSMSTDTDYTRITDDGTEEKDPVDGITAGKGTLTIESGTYNIYTNGDCLKGTGKDGKGGVVIDGGTLNLVSYLSTAIKSKNGNITINSGDVNINNTADNAIQAKNYKIDITGGTIDISDCGKNAIKAGGNVTISGGAVTINDCKKDAINTDADVTISGASTKVTIDKCYGDGVQGENIDIQNGTINIKTYYEYAATNFYSSNWSGYVNSTTESGSTKKETVNYDTGSHKALKAGTKEKTYSYTTISDETAKDSEGNKLVAGQSYSQTASGGLTISGGTITLDTTNTGIKYNGGSSSSGGNMGGAPGGAPGSNMGGGDSKSIIGSPDDAIHSNNTASISGGTITIYSSDDGITVVNTLDITGNANINIATAYEGIEGGVITIGTNDNSDTQPTVKVYSNDDGINAAKKTNTTYVYADENEETYTKTTVAGSNNTLTIYGGNVTVEIADDQKHSVTLSGTAKDGSGTQTYTFSADGDGIDCNGSFYAYGGTIITIGGTSNGNGVFDRDGSFVIGEGVTLFGIGTAGMIEGPTEAKQPYIQYTGSSSGSGFGGFGGNGRGGNSESSSIASGSTITINDSTGKTLFTYTTNKAASYILYSSPSLSNGSTYTLKSGTTTLSTLTATTSASSVGTGRR